MYDHIRYNSKLPHYTINKKPKYYISNEERLGLFGKSYLDDKAKWV